MSLDEMRGSARALANVAMRRPAMLAANSAAMPAAMLRGVLVAFFALLAGCASRSPAPVFDRAPAAEMTAPSAPVLAAAVVVPADLYTVKKGDTLYSIALDHGIAYRDVVAWNNIENPNIIRIGQQLKVTPPDGAVVTNPIAAPALIEAHPSVSNTNTETYKREPKGGKQPWSEQAAGKAEETRNEIAPVALIKPAEPAPAASAETNWAWPSGNKVIANFVEGGNKGIDIGGKIGEPVLAAEAGKVTYANNAIRGYGNLLIIQHPGGMTSVYAHNSKLLAKEGQTVTKGQKVAEIGNTDTDQPKLHFEIRHQGKPLDPLKLLPAR